MGTKTCTIARPTIAGVKFAGAVSPEWLPWGTWLHEAVNEFADPYKSKLCQGQADNRALLQIDLKHRLNSGIGLVGFGSKNSPAEPMEWIPGKAWFFLNLDPEQPNVVRGEGVAYWHVQIIDLNRHTAACKSTAAVPKPATRRGPPDLIRQGIAAKMLADLRSGKESGEGLGRMKQEALAAAYGVSRSTAQKARTDALSEFLGE